MLVITRSMLLDKPNVDDTGELRILVLEDPKLHTSFLQDVSRSGEHGAGHNQIALIIAHSNRCCPKPRRMD